ncbi:hypothetical protein [Aquabacterium sp. OR-4]|uniref:hypothetical protein n=1 Tax=Aquabacterium sp. OR-4 TaxID=2978127 RepID=UPI0021B17E80|nr:hypothetical protein [Aquabacterium sp. OR-4]MDT7835857.1 hypothetical protein [Aquabacterium sp. OR-4]
MTEHLQLIAGKLAQLERMRGYLDYSITQIRALFPVAHWHALKPEQHESLAAFRIRFSEYQEHLGKAMRAVAIEEEIDVDRFGSVLAFMERLQVIDQPEHWKLIRELRNAVNHDYEENTERLNGFFQQMLSEAAVLFSYHQRLAAFCRQAYGHAG